MRKGVTSATMKRKGCAHLNDSRRSDNMDQGVLLNRDWYFKEGFDAADSVRTEVQSALPGGLLDVLPHAS